MLRTTKLRLMVHAGASGFLFLIVSSGGDTNSRIPYNPMRHPYVAVGIACLNVVVWALCELAK